MERQRLLCFIGVDRPIFRAAAPPAAPRRMRACGGEPGSRGGAPAGPSPGGGRTRRRGRAAARPDEEVGSVVVACALSRSRDEGRGLPDSHFTRPSPLGISPRRHPVRVARRPAEAGTGFSARRQAERRNPAARGETGAGAKHGVGAGAATTARDGIEIAGVSKASGKKRHRRCSRRRIAEFAVVEVEAVPGGEPVLKKRHGRDCDLPGAGSASGQGPSGPGRRERRRPEGGRRSARLVSVRASAIVSPGRRNAGSRGSAP